MLLTTTKSGLITRLMRMHQHSGACSSMRTSRRFQFSEDCTTISCGFKFSVGTDVLLPQAAMDKAYLV